MPDPLSSEAEASAVVEPGTNPSRRIGGSCFGRGRVRAKRIFPFVTDAHRRMVGLAMRRQPIGCRAAACRADFGFRLVIPESRFVGWDAGRSGSVSALPWRRDSGCTQPERMERVRRLRPDALCRSVGSASPVGGYANGDRCFRFVVAGGPSDGGASDGRNAVSPPSRVRRRTVPRRTEIPFSAGRIETFGRSFVPVCCFIVVRARR